MNYSSSEIRGVCRIALLAVSLLVTGFVPASDEEPLLTLPGQEPLHLRYVGAQYLLVTVADKQAERLVHRKLVQGQSFSLPLLNGAGKKQKYFDIMVGKRALKLKLACSAKQLNNQLGVDVFKIQYSKKRFKKPPCFIEDKTPEANIPPAA